MTTDEQTVRNILRANIKKYRHRRNWSQFKLAEIIDISTNFLADMECGNSWVSVKTLVKLANAFDIEVYELLKPEKSGDYIQDEDEQVNNLIGRFSLDLTVVLKDSVDKAVEHVRNEFLK